MQVHPPAFRHIRREESMMEPNCVAERGSPLLNWWWCVFFRSISAVVVTATSSVASGGSIPSWIDNLEMYAIDSIDDLMHGRAG